MTVAADFEENGTELAAATANTIRENAPTLLAQWLMGCFSNSMQLQNVNLMSQIEDRLNVRLR